MAAGLTILGLIIIAFGLLLLAGFSAVVLLGAPYLPTMRSQRQTALELLQLKPGQTLYDLGCGDGRMLRSAAQSGLNAVGYELNPALVLTAKIINWPYRRQVKIYMRNYWKEDISAADGIFVFLLDKYMPKLDRKIRALNKPIKLASYTFQVPGKKPLKKKNAVYLYGYGLVASKS